MRGRKFIDSCDLEKFKSYAVRYGCNDEKSHAIMSVFFIYVAENEKVYHTLRKREIAITSETKDAFINIMKLHD